MDKEFYMNNDKNKYNYYSYYITVVHNSYENIIDNDYDSETIQEAFNNFNLHHDCGLSVGTNLMLLDGLTKADGIEQIKYFITNYFKKSDVYIRYTSPMYSADYFEKYESGNLVIHERVYYGELTEAFSESDELEKVSEFNKNHNTNYKTLGEAINSLYENKNIQLVKKMLPFD